MIANCPDIYKAVSNEAHVCHAASIRVNDESEAMILAVMNLIFRMRQDHKDHI